MRIKSGDRVQVLSGKDRGKIGKVLQVFVRERKASVEGINIMIKHLRPNKKGEKGQKVEFPAPLYIDKLMLICPKCEKPTRVGSRYEGKKKVRVCKKCHEMIP